jgi:hypothetical protein
LTIASKYVRGNIHTNGLENFFSLLKRMVKGTYVQVSPWHLNKYVAEQTFRFNNRKDENGDGGRFHTVIGNTTGRRLTYKELTFPTWAFEG